MNRLETIVRADVFENRSFEDDGFRTNNNQAANFCLGTNTEII
jgi:hypothetical protein